MEKCGNWFEMEKIASIRSNKHCKQHRFHLGCCLLFTVMTYAQSADCNMDETAQMEVAENEKPEFTPVFYDMVLQHHNDGTVLALPRIDKESK